MADDWFAQYAPPGGGLMPADATEQGGWNGGVGGGRFGLTDPGQGGWNGPWQVARGGGGFGPGAGGIGITDPGTPGAAASSAYMWNHPELWTQPMNGVSAADRQAQLAQQGPPPWQTATGVNPGGGSGAGGDASWWNPADPKGSITALFGGQPPSSQTILAHAPQLQAAGIQISPPNAEGVTSKINIPGVGWTRILEGGTAGGQGTGWNYVPQGDSSGGAGGGNLGGGSVGSVPRGDFSGALSALSSLGSLQQRAAEGLASSPGYQFGLQQGQQALERGAAAKGTLLTGGTAKALDRYGQDYASTKYAEQYNRLAGEQGTGFNQNLLLEQAGFGQDLNSQQNRAAQLLSLAQLGATSATAQGNLGNSYANQAGNILGSQATGTGNLLTGAGNANAASTIAQANAWAQGVNGVGNAANSALQMYYLSRLYGGGGTPAQSAQGPYASGYQY